ncbi:hypothetical protein ACWJIM_08025 [Proteus mirabilis]
MYWRIMDIGAPPQTCRACLWREGAVRPPVEAGTRRGDSEERSRDPRPLGRGGCQY